MYFSHRVLIGVVVLSAAVLAVAGSVRAGRHASCSPEAFASAQALVAMTCDCAAGPHGRYVRCVAHAAKRLMHDGSLDRSCRRALVRGAANSTCGRPESFVTCRRTRGKRTACSIKRSAGQCGARGGTAGATPSCADACLGSPSGAFLD
jgi:hypothetical protein